MIMKLIAMLKKNERSSSEEIRKTIGNKDVRADRRRLESQGLDNSSFSYCKKNKY